MSSNSVRAHLQAIASRLGFARRDEEPDPRANAAQAPAASATAHEAQRERQSPDTPG